MEKLKAILESIKAKGLDLTFLVVRDVRTKEPSITYTFLLLSGILTFISLFDKVKYVADLGLNFTNCRDLLIVMCATYVGRKFTTGSTTAEKGDQ